MISLSKLSFGYKPQKQLFKNLELTIESGRIYGLLGKNAAGKSTLLRLMCGLLYPTAGACEIDGESSKNRRPAFLADIFLVPEETWLPEISIKKWIETHSVFYPKFSEERFFEYLREFKMPETGLLTDLSFGQKKKALIAFGLAANTKIILMDEPTNGLDIPSKAEFRRIVASALDESRTMVISTHQVRDLDALIDAVVIVDNGQILLAAPLDSVAEKMVFAVEPRADETDADLLFFEKTMFGAATVRVNDGFRNDSRVDLELLFNAAIQNPARVKNLF